MNIEPINEETVLLVQQIEVAMKHKATAVDMKAGQQRVLDKSIEEHMRWVNIMDIDMRSTSDLILKYELAIRDLYSKYNAIVNANRQPK